MGRRDTGPASATLREAGRLETARRRRIETARRVARSRYAITLSVKGSYDASTGRWPRYVWPILYRSDEEARVALARLPVFASNAALPGRVRSASVGRVTLSLETAAAELAGRAAWSCLAGRTGVEAAVEAARAAMAGIGVEAPPRSTDTASRVGEWATSRIACDPGSPSLRRLGRAALGGWPDGAMMRVG